MKASRFSPATLFTVANAAFRTMQAAFTALVLGALPWVCAAQQPGDLDLDFGCDVPDTCLGKVTTYFDTEPEVYGSDVAIQADGKIVVVGGGNDFAVARYLPDGTLDPYFGTGGKVTTDFSGGNESGFGVAIQTDGKIVVAGGGDDFAVARYLPDGTLDSDFGTGGKVTTDISWMTANLLARDSGHAVAIQADGKIVASGIRVYNDQTKNYDFAIARYLPDGTLDSTFGADGVVTTLFDGADFAFASAMAIQADGKIVVAGNSGYRFAVARYLPDGTLDSDFGTSGKVITTPDGYFYNIATAVAIQSDGKIVLAGVSGVAKYAQLDFAVARYLSGGTLDSTFGSDGVVTTNFFGTYPNSSTENSTAVAIQADGKIVVAGTTLPLIEPYDYDFAVARYLPDGTLDSDFGTSGKVTTDFLDVGDNFDDYGSAVAIQADGKIVVAGSSIDSVKTHAFAVARYLVSVQTGAKQLIAETQKLVDSGDLLIGQGTSLTKKLKAAIKQLDAGITSAAVGTLQSYIAEIEAYIAAGILSEAQGRPLIDAAQSLIDQQL